MSKMAMAVTKTADNAISVLRFMGLSFLILICSWERVRWAGARWTPSGLRPGVILWICKGPADSNGPWRISGPPRNLKPTSQATRVIAYTDRDLCRTGLGLRRGLDRNQSGQRSKPLRGVLLSFLTQLEHRTYPGAYVN